MNQPNVLFILIDDMGWKDIACQGSDFYETPNIDRIAKEGMQFTKAYASCPVCSPTRASLMSGKYPARVGITQWIGGKTRGKVIAAPYLHYLPLEEISLARAFKNNGYATYHVGKWHLGDAPYYPEHHGFDINIGGCNMGSPWHGYFSPYKIPTLPEGPKGEYLTDRMGAEAVNLLHIHKSNNENPFFMYMSFYSVHRPIQVPKNEIAYFEEKAKKMGLDQIEPFQVEEIDFRLDRYRLDTIQRRTIQSDPIYAAMIKRLDSNIGKILDKLDELGYSDNTIVIFYSDNGGLSDGRSPPTSNLPLRNGKSYVYEGGIREPFLIRWPQKIQAGLKSDYPVTTPDFYPTLLEMCNLPLLPNQHVDGKSFASIFDDLSALDNSPRGPIFWHYPHYNGNGAFPASVVLDGDWKLIHWHEDDRIELFNLKKDPGEHQDLHDTYPDHVSRLWGLLDVWKKDVHAKMPLPNDHYQFYNAEFSLYNEGFLLKSLLDEEPNMGDSTEPKQLLIRTTMAETNPILYNIPLGELLADMLDKTLLLKIGNEIFTGHLNLKEHPKDADVEELWFYNTHSEENLPFEELVKEYLDQKIEVRAWDKFPKQNLNQYPHLQPQVEITRLD